SESVETVVLWALARRHLGLKFRVEIAATRAMLLASLPYYLTLFATTAYGKLDVSLLEFMGSTEEVGWYGAANAVAGLTLLATPLIGWVLMPMFARAAARSQEEFYEQIRRSMELVLTVASPGGDGASRARPDVRPHVRKHHLLHRARDARASVDADAHRGGRTRRERDPQPGAHPVLDARLRPRRGWEGVLPRDAGHRDRRVGMHDRRRRPGRIRSSWRRDRSQEPARVRGGCRGAR